MDPDFHVRLAAIDHLQALQLRYDDMIPRREILKNLLVDDRSYALFNPQAGIHRPRLFRGAAALTRRLHLPAGHRRTTGADRQPGDGSDT